MLEEHEELAEYAFIGMLILGAVAGVLYFFVHRNRHMDYKKGLWAVIVLSAGMFLMMALVGNHGGKIRRPELRGEMVQNQSHEDHHDDHEESDH